MNCIQFKGFERDPAGGRGRVSPSRALSAPAARKHAAVEGTSDLSHL